MYDILQGVRVLEAAAYLMVPTAAAILGDWGADVIKVEHPVAGDPYRGLRNDAVEPGLPNPMLEIPNRGKRSVGIDLSNPEGLEVVYELIRHADVFLTSFLSPTLSRLRLDWDSVRAINPRIVYGRGTGYGPRGPEANTPGFDLAATWARAGFMHRMTPPDADEPAQFPGSVGDLTGGLTLASGAVAALYKRDRTGKGLQVDVSLYHIGMWVMAQSIGAAPFGLAPEPISGSRQHVRNPLVNSYRTSDNRWIVLCILQPQKYWDDFCQHIEKPDLIDDERFVNIDALETNARELVAILDDVFAQRTLAEWRERLRTMTGVWAPALSASEIAVDPQVMANDYFPEVGSADGTTFRSVASPIQFGGETIGELHAMPEHAQHTEEVLLELGWSWDDLSRLKESAAIS